MFLGCTPRPSTDPILIGHVASFAGPDQALGEQAKQALELAVEEVNNDPGLLLNRRVEVLHVNSAGDDNTIADAAVRLITVNRVVAILGGDTLQQAERLGRAAQSYSIPVVTPAGLTSPYASDNLFPVGIAPEFTGQTLARFSAQELKARHVGSVSDARVPFATAVTSAFVHDYSQGEGRRVEQCTFRNEGAREGVKDREGKEKQESELPDAASRVARSHPDAILFAGSARALIRFREHLTGAAGQKPVLFGGEEVPPGELLALQQDRTAKSPIYVPTAFAGDGGATPGQAFAKRYRERFHLEPTAAAALAYDAARLLFQGIRDANTAERERVRETLSKTVHFDSLTGPISWEKDRLVRRPVFVLRVEKGTAELAKREPPP
jgi:branched-chain amino acid transport system substrate-binding protein